MSGRGFHLPIPRSGWWAEAPVVLGAKSHPQARQPNQRQTTFTPETEYLLPHTFVNNEYYQYFYIFFRTIIFFTLLTMSSLLLLSIYKVHSPSRLLLNYLKIKLLLLGF